MPRPWLIRLFSLSILVCILLATTPVLADVIRPYVRFTGGWTDNVRLRRVAQADFFGTITPGVRLELLWPAHEFKASAEAGFTHYLDHTALSGFDNATVNADYTYKGSQRWKFQASDYYTSTYDKPELNDAGEVVDVRGGDGRIDRNTLRLRLGYHYSPMNWIEATYNITHTLNQSGTPDSEDSFYNRLNLEWNHRFKPVWEIRAGASGIRDDYEYSVDTDRYKFFTQLIRLMGPNMKVWGSMEYTMNRALSSSDEINTARDYSIVAVGAGFYHAPSQNLNYTFSAGWSMVQGDKDANSAADQGFPLLDARLNYKGQRWSFSAYASADLGSWIIWVTIPV